MRTLKGTKNEGGFVLVAVYLVIALVAILSLAFFARNNAFIQAVERNHNKMTAFNMAEAAVDVALTQLATNIGYTGTSGFTPLDTAFFRGGYTVTVTIPPDNANVRIIQAGGFAPNNDPASRAYQAATITAYAEIVQKQLFEYAVFAADSVTLTGGDKIASVDSYNSNNGDYGPGNSGNNGDIAVNSTDANAITLTGTTIVNGDAVVGAGGDPATSISAGAKATITGSQTAAPQPVIYQAPTTSVPTSGALDISGGTTTLLPGVYHYSSIKISGQGQLQTNGSVQIFVDGGIDISGQGIVTADNKPTNLLIYVTGSEGVDISGQGNLYAGIYAPNSVVSNTGNGKFMGSVISKSYAQSGNSSIHFDEALKDVVSEQNSKFQIKVWQEQNSLTWGT